MALKISALKNYYYNTISTLLINRYSYQIPCNYAKKEKYKTTDMIHFCKDLLFNSSPSYTNIFAGPPYLSDLD